MESVQSVPNSSRLGMNFPQTDMQALVAQQWQQRRDHRWRSSGGGGGSNSCMLGTGGSAAHNNPGGSMDFFLNMWEVYMPCGFWDGKSASGSASEVPHMEPTGREVGYPYPHGLGRPPPHALPAPPSHMFNPGHHSHPQSPTGPGGHHHMDGMGVGGPPQGPHTAPPTPGPCGPSNGSGGGGVGGGASSPLVVPHPVKAPRPIRTYHCRMCDQVFDSRSDLLVHSQHVHKQDPKPYKCQTCNKCFANSSYLSQHARIHSGIKPYKCNICERRFTQLCHLQQHIRTHTGEKPYKCQHPGCGKAFSQLSNLQSHSRSHMTDKPYRCNSCYKCFTDEQSLREHIPKHSETKHLKTHICKICGKSYTQETYLARHMTKHSEGGAGSPRSSGSNSMGSMCGVPHHMGLNTHKPSPLPVVSSGHVGSSGHMLGGRGPLDSPMDTGMSLGSLHDQGDKPGSAFMPLPHQFGPGPNFMNSSVSSSFPFPSPRLPSANASSLNSSLSHVSCGGVPSPQRYFPFDTLPLPKRDAVMDMMDRGLPRDMAPSNLLSRRQMKEFSTSHPVFPKSEPSSPMAHCPKDYN